jgi:hypothetical protein
MVEARRRKCSVATGNTLPFPIPMTTHRNPSRRSRLRTFLRTVCTVLLRQTVRTLQRAAFQGPRPRHHQDSPLKYREHVKMLWRTQTVIHPPISNRRRHVKRSQRLSLHWRRRSHRLCSKLLRPRTAIRPSTFRHLLLRNNLRTLRSTTRRLKTTASHLSRSPPPPPRNSHLAQPPTFLARP